MKDSIIFHHSGIPRRESQYDRVREYHNRGAPDVNGKLKWPAGYGCQYAYFIDVDGEVIEANPPERVTWHAGSWYWNQRGIGLCYAGHGGIESITDEQLKALAALTIALQRRFGVSDDGLYNHSDVRTTECPGRDIREMVLTEKKKVMLEKVEHLRKVIDRTEPPRKYILERMLSRLLKLLPL